MRPKDEPVLRIGLLADTHYADKSDDENRCYRSSLDKVCQAVEHDGHHRHDHSNSIEGCGGDVDDVGGSHAFARSARVTSFRPSMP